MKDLDIDSLPCVELEKQATYVGIWGKKLRVHEFGMRHLGFYPEKLYDWRGLERRAHELHTRATDLYAAFTEELEAFHKKGLEQGLTKTWVVAPSGQYVIEWDNGGWSTRELDRIVTEHVGNPSKKGLMVTGEAADRINRNRIRYGRMLTRAGTYGRAFRIAVEERLKPFMHKERRRTDFGRDERIPTIFVVRNDDRQYVVTFGDQYQVVWSSHEVYVSKG